ncbi:multimeric flavodoxin WrbA [Kinneretia asaccharophila]|uniref:Multimeric flavodoxin WrbA n=2 Tax=Roseateles asaccharophilus TaxID=582607 RepID=A0ABU2AD66_9BURK|nr:multimeric flavodoxin WrbA [Roseateles asaccharophilus]
MTRDEFGARFRQRFVDPAFDAEREALARLEQIAWEAFHAGRKAPITVKAGAGFADPDYDLSREWRDLRQRLDDAQARWSNAETPSRVLLINASPRNDGSCPGEMSKTWRLMKMARAACEAEGATVDELDLSRLTSDYDRHIHPCKGCVSTAMPLCHWPCSCYPNHASGQTNDWMGDIYELWVRAHGVLLLTPVHWYQATSPLKLMMDRLVCADGGNPDPTSTQGKKAQLAREMELKGWDYPKHLAGRVYGLVVHGDVAGIDGTRRALSDWLDWMGLQDAGFGARLERYIGYYEPYASSHDALDADLCVQDEVRRAARAVARSVGLMRAGLMKDGAAGLPQPRTK